MRTRSLIAAGLTSIALVATLAACSTDADTASSSSSASSSASSSSSSSATTVDSGVKLTGTFSGENDKKVSGTVTISGSTVTLSGFSSDEGPDLHLYLTNGVEEPDVAAGVELGAVKYDAASQTFTLPSGVDASDFENVVVHCDKALAVFGAATLES